MSNDYGKEAELVPAPDFDTAKKIVQMIERKQGPISYTSTVLEKALEAAEQQKDVPLVERDRVASVLNRALEAVHSQIEAMKARDKAFDKFAEDAKAVATPGTLLAKHFLLGAAREKEMITHYKNAAEAAGQLANNIFEEHQTNEQRLTSNLLDGAHKQLKVKP